LAGIRDGEERLILATGRYIGEGFDDARLDTLFLALPVSWKGTVVQYTGRLHRLHPAKTEVRIFDYVDREVPMLLRMFEKRLARIPCDRLRARRGAARVFGAWSGGRSRVRRGSPSIAVGDGGLRVRTPRTPNPRPRISRARLEEMIEEATTDAYGESERTTGWFTAIEEH